MPWTSTSDADSAAAAGPARVAPWRRLRRLPQQRVITGTAAGLAELARVDTLVVRVAFVVLGLAGGAGVVLYLLAFVVSSFGAVRAAPVDRMRPARSTDNNERLMGVGLVTLGLLIMVRGLGLGFIDSLVWPVSALAVAFVIAAQHSSVDLATVSGLGGGDGSRGWIAARIASGLALAVGGFFALLAFNFDIGAARDVVLATVVIGGGIGLVLGPWVWRVATELVDERRRRIRSEERAELAAQLHDSVLQTLSLIQRHHADPQQMVQLARRQERELRSWLHGDGRLGHSEHLREGLVTAAAEVEDLHGIPIEVVVVGDTTTDERVAGLLMAAREAMVNASRHSGSPSVDVYAEVTGGTAQIFVRDTGIGFDTGTVPTDRRGVRDSIEGRMHRLGGHAQIVSEPGGGTEVELELPLSAADRRTEDDRS